MKNEWEIKKYRARFLPTNRIYWIQILPEEMEGKGIKVLNFDGTRSMILKDEKEFNKFWKIYEK